MCRQKFIYNYYLVVLMFLFVSKTNTKCTTTFITNCEKIADISRHGRKEWTNLIISNDQCKPEESNTPTDILKPNIFNNVPNLEELIIVEKVSEIQPGAFNGLNQLTYLKLYKNLIKVIGRGAFTNLTQLFKLDLQNNAIENIEHGLFQGASISTINLSHNKINNIQVDQLSIPTLKKLVITNNDISIMVEGCFHANMEVLNLDNNDISEIEKGVLNPLENLKELILSNNKLSTVTARFKLPNLEKLDFSHNKIQWIEDDAFKEFPELKYLYLGYNRLTYLSSNCFPRESSVQILHLHKNSLMHLDAKVGARLASLKELSIGGNPWTCSCLEVILQYMGMKSIEHPECEKEFFNSGLSPVCWATGEMNCIGNEKATTEIYEEFQRSIKTQIC